MNIGSINDIESTEEQSGVTTDRRSFLKAAGGVAAAAILPVAAASWATPAAAQGTELKKGDKMKTRKLGKLEVSELGFATWVSAAAITVRVWTGPRAFV